MDLNGSGVDLGWIWVGSAMDLEWIWGGSGLDLGWFWDGSGMDLGSGTDPALIRHFFLIPLEILIVLSDRLARRTPHWTHSGPFF